MKVFISWSGERSKAVASALKSWIPDVLQDVDTWMSEHDIEPGARWAQALSAELQACSYGVICLTPENLARPWLLFEAGSLAKVMDNSYVAPYRLGISAAAIEFPLAQFQGVDADEGGTLKLIQGVNRRRDSPMNHERVARHFGMWWPKLKDELAKVPPTESPATARRDPSEMIEETLSLVRQLMRPRQQIVDPRMRVGSDWKFVSQLSEEDIRGATTEYLQAYLSEIKRLVAYRERSKALSWMRKVSEIESELARRSPKSAHPPQEPPSEAEAGGAANREDGR